MWGDQAQLFEQVGLRAAALQAKVVYVLPSFLAGVCPRHPSLRGEGAAGRYEAAGAKEPEAYSLEYVEDCFAPRTTQMPAARLPQQNGMTRTDSELQVFEKPSSGLEDEQGLHARMVSEGAEGLKGREFLRLVRFVQRGNGRGVWNGDREGYALMEFDLRIEQADGFGFSEAQAIENLHGSLLEPYVDTDINPVWL